MYAGVDYGGDPRAAQAEADVIIWDGGNNDLPFFAPDLHDRRRRPAARRATSCATIPGEANLRMADVVVVNKVDTRDARSRSRRC